MLSEKVKNQGMKGRKYGYIQKTAQLGHTKGAHSSGSFPPGITSDCPHLITCGSLQVPVSMGTILPGPLPQLPNRHANNILAPLLGQWEAGPR